MKQKMIAQAVTALCLSAMAVGAQAQKVSDAVGKCSNRFYAEMNQLVYYLLRILRSVFTFINLFAPVTFMELPDSLSARF